MGGGAFVFLSGSKTGPLAAQLTKQSIFVFVFFAFNLGSGFGVSRTSGARFSFAYPTKRMGGLFVRS